MSFETVTVGTTKVSWPILGAALIAMPIAAVFGLRTLKAQPASAFGQQIEETSSFKAKEDVQVSGPALALVSQFNAEATRGFGPSPMINKAPPPPKVAPQETPVEPVHVEPRPGVPVQVAPPPELQVTSIMKANNGQMMAVINGKTRRVGDAVGNGYTIKSITAGEVLVTNRSGDVATFLLKKRAND